MEDLKYPAYWPNENWKMQWGHGTEDADDLCIAAQLGNEKYASAELGCTSPVGLAIVDYIKHNVVAKTYTAPKREATRMRLAETLANDKNQSAAVQASNSQRAQEGRRGGLPPPTSGAIEIRRIKVLRNPVLWEQYAKTREELRQIIKENPLEKVKWTHKEKEEIPQIGALPIIDGEVGEVLLFHGTNKEVMKMIALGGFKPEFCRNKGSAESPNYGALGQGAYFSDCFAKVMTYTVCRKCGAYTCNCLSKRNEPVKRVTFLSRVLLGEPKNKRAFGQPNREDIRKQDLNSLDEQGRNSVYARGFELGDLKFVSGSNEFVIKNARQLYPEFVIYWTHEKVVTVGGYNCREF